MTSDVIVAPVGQATMSVSAGKPTYFIVIDDGSSLSKHKFLTIDSPDLQASYVKAKGFYVDFSEEDIGEHYQETLANIPKDLVKEMIFPWHTISSIRNLVFKVK